MRDAKSLLLIVLSFLLFVVSFTLLWTWGYRVYIKSPADRVKTESVHKDSLTADNGTRDSLQKIYSATINNLDTHIDSTWNNMDSLTNRLDLRLGEFYRLRSEIAVLLKDHGTTADIELARQKIAELQQRVKDLLNKNLDVEYENKKLAAVLQQLSDNNKTIVPTVQRTTNDNKVPAEKTEPPVAGFAATDLHLTAMMTNADREQETSLAQETEKLVGSIVLKSNTVQNNNNEVVVVVLQPDGQVLKNSAWESGTFLSDEGKKVYSYKLRFDYSRGEAKRLFFSLSADSYQKGNYTMQVYYNGLLIGKMLKTLS